MVFDSLEYVTIGTAILIAIFSWIFQSKLYKKELETRLKNNNEIQIGLLHSLAVELKTISNPLLKIKINYSEYETKGNLQWYEEIVTNNRTASHNLWTINVNEYITKLNNKISKVNTIELKKMLVLISQKLELIQYYMQKYDRKNDYLLEVIKETKEYVKDAKLFLKINFNIN